ncbi:MAG: histidine triad nucleotide-binding protein [Gemmatimonadota bacterium]|nr:histidine triad nucleotide-binding protein [Gemmatimonadota bacterium]
MNQVADCLFCRIASGQIPAEIVAEGDEWLAFHDVSPQAPVHVLIIPRSHVESVAALDGDSVVLAGRLLTAAADVARALGVSDDGYRLVTNRGARAGQSVFHLHVHLLAGRDMAWPPG